MLFRVVINDEVEIRREWPWEKIAQVKEKLKKLGFKWTGSYWKGRIFSLIKIRELKDLLQLEKDEIEKLVNSVLRSFGSRASGAVIALEDIQGLELPGECVRNEGGVYVVSLTCLLRHFLKNDRRLLAEASSYEDYIDRLISHIRSLLGDKGVLGDLEGALNATREYALSSVGLRALAERRFKWWTVELDLDKAYLNFLASGLWEGLKAISIPYNIYVRGDSGEYELERRELNPVRISRLSDGRVLIEFPVCLRDRIADVLRRFGYRVVEVQYVPRRIHVLRDDVRLYPFQERALKAWLDNGLKGTIVIPTGGGKTFIALKAIATVKVNTLVLVITEELLEQWHERIARYLGIRAGRLGGGYDEIREVTIATYASAYKRRDELYDKFDLVIFDEAHHVPAETFKDVALRLRAPYRMALSATPTRSDGNEHLIFITVGPIVFQARYEDMIDEGLVVPVRHYRIYVDLTPEEKSLYENAKTIHKGNAIVLRNIASMARKKLDIARKIVRKEVEAGGKILVFTQFIKQAEEVYEELKRELGSCVVLITSKSRDRDLALSAFARGVYRIIVTTTVLDEGVDVPDADVAVILSGTGSKRQMVQRVGRVVRASEGKKEARVYEVIARGTIEEVLSEERHFRGYIAEVECKKVLAKDLERVLSKIPKRG